MVGGSRYIKVPVTGMVGTDIKGLGCKELVTELPDSSPVRTTSLQATESGSLEGNALQTLSLSAQARLKACGAQTSYVTSVD